MDSTFPNIVSTAEGRASLELWVAVVIEDAQVKLPTSLVDISLFPLL